MFKRTKMTALGIRDVTSVRSSNIVYSERLDYRRFGAALAVLSFPFLHPIYKGLTRAISSDTAPRNPRLY
ncbi:MAG TPA: hypothetical protein V6D08_16225 [Candidatus Obscuribacterales bacterium]